MNMLEDDEDWDEEYNEEGLDEPVIPCPYCGEEMLEDSPQCLAVEITSLLRIFRQRHSRYGSS